MGWLGYMLELLDGQEFGHGMDGKAQDRIPFCVWRISQTARVHMRIYHHCVVNNRLFASSDTANAMVFHVASC